MRRTAAWLHQCTLLACCPCQVSIQEKQEAGGTRPRTYDLHQADAFWVEHMSAAFQSVAADVDKELSEYREAMEKVAPAPIAPPHRAP